MIYTFVPKLMLEKPKILQTYNFTPDCEPFAHAYLNFLL